MTGSRSWPSITSLKLTSTTTCGSVTRRYACGQRQRTALWLAACVGRQPPRGAVRTPPLHASDVEEVPAPTRRAGASTAPAATSRLTTAKRRSRLTFDRRGLIEQIDRLLLAHRAPSGVYRVGDYHMLVLYEALEYWPALHNDSVDERHPAAKVGRFRVGRVDLGSILDRSFPDLDFLMDELLDASADVKQAIGVRPETFAVVAGLKPHPSELDIVAEARGRFRPAPGPRTGRVVEYPPRRAVKWFDQAHERGTAMEGHEEE